MKQSELVARLAAKQPELAKDQIEEAIDLIHQAIANTLAKHSKAELRGFGVFYTSERAARKIRNPVTGEYFHVPVRCIPRFKAGKKLRLEVDNAAMKARK